jgi:membrane-associated phospholipid phosphatase
MSKEQSNLKKQWQIIAKNKQFRTQFIITAIFLALILYSLSTFLSFVETRRGAVLNDPVLNMFSPVDLTWFTFVILYGALIFALVYFIKRPVLLLKAMTAYGIMVLFRIIAMYILPLDPPTKMIALQDPFVEFFGEGVTLTRDLFFSGHTAIMFIFFLVAESKPVKMLFLVGTITIAGLVLLQHVHYSVDVFVAFFVSYCSFILSNKLTHKLQH